MSAMRSLSVPVLLEFQQVASDIRRQRADLHARLRTLAMLRADTDKLILESRTRIAQSRALLETHGKGLRNDIKG
jgi:hypothetical protein